MRTGSHHGEGRALTEHDAEPGVAPYLYAVLQEDDSGPVATPALPADRDEALRTAARYNHEAERYGMPVHYRAFALYEIVGDGGWTPEADR